MDPAAPATVPPFSLTEGGPFFRLAGRLHLRSRGGATSVGKLVAFTWLPLMAMAAVRMALGGGIDPVVADVSVHARFLVALPLLLYTERMLEPKCSSAIHQLYAGGFAEKQAIDDVIERAKRLRSAASVELVLAIGALVVGQLVLWGAVGATGLIHGITAVGVSFAWVWYAAIALPVFLFLALRWMWRWVIWAYILARCSRISLALIATHPDRAGGIGFFGAPLPAITGFVLAFASVLSGAWATQLLAGTVTVPALVPTLLVFMVAALVVALGPLVPFTTQLYRARRGALRQYNPFALAYVRDFHAKWVASPTASGPLGTPDIQSLADLGHAYDVIVTTRLFVFSPRAARNVLLAALVPMLPLVLTILPVEEMLRRILSTLLGGLAV